MAVLGVVIAIYVGRFGGDGRSEWGFRWHSSDRGVRMLRNLCPVSRLRREGGDREGTRDCR